MHLTSFARGILLSLLLWDHGGLLLQWLLSQTINAFDDVKFEAASVLAELYEQQQQSGSSQSILRKAIELSQHNVYWHCRLIFQLAVSPSAKCVSPSASAGYVKCIAVG